ncbi:hypothetical protein FPV67DRAFT_989288 [Lyophyllum atratum]|nr:hypothetical protein FPV67DRAFT_989288 [Lyophyllum atratum]
MIQCVKSNKDAFERLASDACALVSGILCRDSKIILDVASVKPAYLNHARELAETLREIHEYTKIQASKNKIIRAIQYKSDAGIIQEYRDRLKQSLDLFSLKSTLSIHDVLASIQQQLVSVVDHTRGLCKGEASRQETVLMEAADAKSDVVAKEAVEPKTATEDQVTREKGTKAGWVGTQRGETAKVANGGVDIASTEKETTRLSLDAPEVEGSKAAQVRIDHRHIGISRAPPMTASLNPFPETNPFRAGLPSLAASHHASHPDSHSKPCLEFLPGLHQTFPGFQHGLPAVHSAHLNLMSIGGNQNSYCNTVTNTNSGNVTNHVISNSNNDFSVIHYGRGRWK